MAITATKPRANSRRTTNSFWWVDLQSTNVKASLTFYGKVLGWEFRDEPGITDDFVYDTAHIGGLKLAGIGQVPAPGMPSAWTCYVTVADVDATCTKATELGGTIVQPAMDVLDQGRMAIIADPTGAAFGVWQNGRHTGADAVNQPATLTWTELYSSDADAAMKFYGSLFDWAFEPQDDAPAGAGEGYWMVTQDGRALAGVMAKSDGMKQMPDMWMPYLGVADVEATKAEVVAAGGSVMWGPMQTGPGRSIGIADPQGALLMLIQMDEWPAD